MTARAPLIGVVNAGSSSLKFAVYEGEAPSFRARWTASACGPAAAAKDAAGGRSGPDVARQPPATPAEALALLIPWLRERLGGRPLPPSGTGWCMAGHGTRGRNA